MYKLEKILPIICAILGTIAVYVSLESIVDVTGWLDPITLVAGSQFIAMSIYLVAAFVCLCIIAWALITLKRK